MTDDEAVAETAEAEMTDDEAGASFEPVDEQEDRPRRLKDLKVGMELEGRVTSVALYGVFVDVGVGRDGLVHISEMSDTRINSPSDLVQIGDTVNVRVKGIDVEARRISLSMRSPRERTSNGERNRNRNRRSEVNQELLADLSVGDMVEGTITGLAQFGAFVDIGVGKDGLVHISEMSEGHVDKPEDAVQVGDCHTFKILEVDPEGTRISLSLRRALRLQKMQQLEPGQELEGTVSGMAPFGAFVDIGVGRDGLVHISQLSEDRVGKVEDVVKVGDKVTVRVLEVDSQSKRISLTMRPPEPEPEEGAEPAEEAAPTPPPAPREMRMPTPPAEGGSKRDGKRRGGRGPRTADQPPPKPPETYTTSDDDEEEFEGNATLEDLLTKFGGSSRKDRRRQNTEEEDDEEERQRRKQRQRDVIRRTLQQQNEDE
jgi:transcriptional accessory protein Tex/SPT6